MSCSKPVARIELARPASIAASIAAAASAAGMPLSIAASLTPRVEPSATSAFFETFVCTEPGAKTCTWMPRCAFSARTASW